MLFLLLSSLPSVQATAAGRWGHQAVFVPSQNSIYVVGGEVAGTGTQITNDVLVLPLNSSSPSWNLGPNTGLPAHAFASMALSRDGSNLVVTGGVTSSCGNDATTHSLSLGASAWTSASPSSFIRRRGTGAFSVDDGSAQGEVVVVGGIVDNTVCSSSTAAYTASDVLKVPMSSSAPVSSQKLPSGLTGSSLAVSDFALAQANSTVYLAGGRAADGSFVTLDTIGVWTASGGWTSQKVSGSIPVGRVGASLVAHPKQPYLVLYGGSEANTNGMTYAPSTMLAVLDTKSWQWSQPSAIQAAPSNAVSYHSSVMTPQGVMVTAFGLGPQGTPVTSSNFLDMRDSSVNNWKWESSWSKEMLQPVASHKSSNKKTVTAAVVPTVILLAIIIPLVVYFSRRYIRNARKRRHANHFSFEAQEDNGDFSRPVASRDVYPFGNYNDKDEGFLSNVKSKVTGLFRRNSARSGRPHGIGDDGTITEREMSPINPDQLNEKGNWEEVDFGLGRIDEERREATYTDLPQRRKTPRASLPNRNSFSSEGEHVVGSVPFPMPIASTYSYADDLESAPTGQLIDIDSSPRVGSPKGDGQVLLMSPTIEEPKSTLAAAGADAADWNMLEKSLTEKPAFRSISPTATLRSHAHQSPFDDSHAVPVSPVMSQSSEASTAPSIPPLDFNSSPMMSKQASLSTAAKRVSAPTMRSVSGGSPAVRTLAGGNRVVSQGESKDLSSKHVRRSSMNALGLQNHNRLSKLRVVNPSDEE
ncbi:uncharacterized protein LOC62_05G007669 [Vanrija pseudolonga]|uniref:Galactose oxidase n=1 Tax=Vanrija pseudolonga TaxID=143232 RepID=A0AAF1BT00_9TREE|nr:hypothetical protein LOC62_05G007669 [Vanrija pseudolonga]